MARGKSVVKLLLESSKSAMFAGIEIHNKPHFPYRYPTVIILVVNAWELALKAYIYKFISKKEIYEKRNGVQTGHTIGLAASISIVRDYLNKTDKTSSFNAISENLRKLSDYRNSNVHFYEKPLDAIAFMLASKAVLNYDSFLKKFFSKDITKSDNLVIMPIGFKMPFNPIDYLKQDYGEANNDFVNSIIQSNKKLHDEGINDSIVIDFCLTTKTSNLNNADILVKISNDKDAIELRKEYRITNDPKAPSIRIEPNVPPLTYRDLRNKVKHLMPEIKFGKRFNEIMRNIKKNPDLCKSNYLDPKNKSGMKKDFYAEKAIEEVVEQYKALVNSNLLVVN